MAVVFKGDQHFPMFGIRVADFLDVPLQLTTVTEHGQFVVTFDKGRDSSDVEPMLSPLCECTLTLPPEETPAPNETRVPILESLLTRLHAC